MCKCLPKKYYFPLCSDTFCTPLKMLLEKNVTCLAVELGSIVKIQAFKNVEKHANQACACTHTNVHLLCSLLLPCLFMSVEYFSMHCQSYYMTKPKHLPKMYVQLKVRELGIKRCTKDNINKKHHAISSNFLHQLLVLFQIVEPSIQLRLASSLVAVN